MLLNEGTEFDHAIPSDREGSCIHPKAPAIHALSVLFALMSATAFCTYLVKAGWLDNLNFLSLGQPAANVFWQPCDRSFICESILHPIDDVVA